MEVIMRFLAVFILSACIAFPVFSQETNSQRYKALGDSMNTTLTRSNAKLANFDSLVLDDGANKVFTSYKRQFDFLASALNESEEKLNLLLRTYDRSEIIKTERENYSSLVKQLQSVKTEYDGWLRTVQ